MRELLQLRSCYAHQSVYVVVEILNQKMKLLEDMIFGMILIAVYCFAIAESTEDVDDEEMLVECYVLGLSREGGQI